MRWLIRSSIILRFIQQPHPFHVLKSCSDYIRKLLFTVQKLRRRIFRFLLVQYSHTLHSSHRSKPQTFEKNQTKTLITEAETAKTQRTVPQTNSAFGRRTGSFMNGLNRFVNNHIHFTTISHLMFCVFFSTKKNLTL